MAKPRILVVRKMSPLEYYYKGNHENPLLREGHVNHNKSVEKVQEFLTQKNMDFDMVTRKDISEEFVNSYDIVFSLGGDGTSIAVASFNKDKPQLNLKSEIHSVGALCQQNMEEALEKTINGEYHIENWTREDVYLNGKFIGRACNEVCVGEKLRFDKYSKYILGFRDKNSNVFFEEEQGGSGLIVVTGTGSTAWPAAFKPFPRDSDYFRFKTLLLHNGTRDAGEASGLELLYKNHEGKFSIDTLEYDFPRDSILEIKISEHPLKIIVPNVAEKK